MMLISLIFKLRPVTDLLMPMTLGSAFYAVLLQLIGRHDAALAKTLHDSQGPKPFTTSPLQGPQTPRGHEVRLQENGAYWLRVTSIDPYLSDILATLESTPPSHMTLHQGRFDVLQVSSQPQDHPWAARSSYEQLYSDAQRRQGGGRPHVTMRFESATAFHSQGRTHVLPLPRLVFGSLLNRWNAYAPVELHEDLAEEFDLGLDIEQHELKTVIQNFRRYQLQVGFVGSCRYRVRQGAPPEVISGMRLLAGFAPFSGVGYRTTMGMGQVRLAAPGRER